VGPAYMTPVELAAEVRVSPKSIYRWAAEESPMSQIGLGSGKGSTLRFPRAPVMRWLRQREGQLAEVRHENRCSLPSNLLIYRTTQRASRWTGLAPGERAVIGLAAADRPQAQVLLGFASAPFREAEALRLLARTRSGWEALRRLVTRETRWSVDLQTNVTLEVRTAAFGTSRAEVSLRRSVMRARSGPRTTAAIRRPKSLPPFGLAW
jgi:hypothetical protein